MSSILVKTKKVFSLELKNKQSGIWFTAVYALICAFSVPQKVTVDGIFYISSAKSLFSEKFASAYAAYREPGYPLFLWCIHQLGNAAVFVTLIQGALLGASLFLCLWSINHLNNKSTIKLYTLITVAVLGLNPMFISYSGLFLQQAIFTFILSIFVVTTALTINQPNKRKFLVPVLAFTNYLVGVVISIGWIYLGLIPTIFAISVYLSRQMKVQNLASKFSKLILNILIISVSGLFTYLVSTKLFEIWKIFKNSQIKTDTLVKSVIEPLNNVPYIPSPVEMFDRISSLLHIKTISPYVFENDLFLSAQMRINYPISEYDTAYISEPFSSFASNYFLLSNPSLVMHTVLSIFTPIAAVIYTGLMVLTILGAGIFLIQKKYSLLLISLVGIQFVAVYAASNSPIDRYGLPVYPIAIAVFIALFTKKATPQAITSMSG